MVDFIKIWLDDFSGDLEKNCRKLSDGEDKETGLLYENYTLSNGRSSLVHKMKLHKQAGGKNVIIEGSVRKWGNNKDSAADLNVRSFERVMKKLAKKLGIPFEEICSARFTQTEIGLNVRTSIPAYRVSPMAIRYGKLKRKDDEFGRRGTAYFIGKVKKLKLYDKGKEIGDNALGADNRRKRKAMFDRLGKDDIYLLRVEYTLDNHKAFGQHRMGLIETIGDLIKHYSELYEFWSRETNRIVIYNKVVPQKGMNKTDARHASNLGRYGFEGAIEIAKSGIDEEKKSASVSKSDAYGKMLALIYKYDADEYNVRVFRNDASDQLDLIRRLGGVFDLQKCLDALNKKPRFLNK